MRSYIGMDLPKTAEEMALHFPGGFDEYDVDIERYANKLMPQYMFIRKNTKKEIGFCTNCGEEMNLKAIWPEEYAGWKHGDEINCPRCGRKVHIVTRNMTRIWDKCFFYWWEKSAADKNSIICRGIVMDKGWPDGDPWHPYERIWTDSAILFSYGNGAVMAIKGDGRIGYKLAGRVHSRQMMFEGDCCHRGAVIGEPVACLRAAVKGTPFQWSQWYKLERMRKKGTDIYIRVFERFARYRAWEWLTKMGLAHILMAYAEGDPDIWPLFNWRGKSVDAIFRCHLTKSDKAVLRNERIEESMLRAWMQWKKYQPKAALNDILQIWPEYWRKQRIKTESMQEVMKRITPEEWIRYEKARTKDVRFITDYVDYIGECMELGMDLTDRKILWPKDLGTAHRKTSARIKLKRDAAMESKYTFRRGAMVKKYEWENRKTGLRIVVPGTLETIIEEGESQHNCVGGYIQRVANGETDVIFVRTIERPDKSYITVEVDPVTGKIRQAREKYNREVQAGEAREFLKAFERKVRREMA